MTHTYDLKGIRSLHLLGFFFLFEFQYLNWEQALFILRLEVNFLSIDYDKSNLILYLQYSQKLKGKKNILRYPSRFQRKYELYLKALIFTLCKNLLFWEKTILTQIMNGITFKRFSNKLLFCSFKFFCVKCISFFVMGFGAYTSKIILWSD